MDYLPYFFCYDLRKHYAYMCCNEGFLSLILLLKILCLSLTWATLALKKGDGHLKERVILVLNCSVAGHSYTLGHFLALLLCLDDPASQEDPARTGCPAPIHSIGLTIPHVDKSTGVSMEDKDVLLKHWTQKSELHGVASHLPYLLTTSLKCSMFRPKMGIQIGG